LCFVGSGILVFVVVGLHKKILQSTGRRVLLPALGDTGSYMEERTLHDLLVASITAKEDMRGRREPEDVWRRHGRLPIEREPTV
jgi:hypothetical protein